MFAELITIGDEILIGQTIDTNSAWMAKELNAIGISIKQIRSIKDERTAILDALHTVPSDCQLVLITGGLGPTKDDITKEVLCEFFETRLIRNEEVLERIDSYFKQRGRPILDSNRRQADLPENATVLNNLLGTASGMLFEKNNKIFISMPGVPYEMKGIVLNEVLPRIKESFQLPVVYHKTIMTEGIGESFLVELIKEWESSLEKEGISVAYLPSPGVVKVRLTASGDDSNKIKARVDKKACELLDIVPTYIFGEDDISLEKAVSQKLLELGQTISSAESCTGGNIASLLTSIPGSSNYFLGSIVSYSNEVKQSELGVSKEDIAKHGAVSKEVVVQMASAVRETLKTDIGVASSGVAGPDGGTEEKPIGMVWIAISTIHGVFAKKYQFENDRQRNIRRASLAALSLVYRHLNGTLEIRS